MLEPSVGALRFQMPEPMPNPGPVPIQDPPPDQGGVPLPELPPDPDPPPVPVNMRSATWLMPAGVLSRSQAGTSRAAPEPAQYSPGT